jgi:hypothetical protein
MDTQRGCGVNAAITISTSLRRRLALSYVCCVAALILAGCSLPNLKPFADSTAQLHSAVVSSSETVPALLREAGKEEEAARLNKALVVRVEAMNAVLKFTESLSHIAEAGESGQQTASKVADSVNSLLSTVKVSPLSGEAVAAVTLAYGIVAQVRAAKSFAEAVERADPAIQGVARILERDFQDTEDLLIQVREPLRRQVLDRDEQTIELLDYRNALEKERRGLEKQLKLKPNSSDAQLQAKLQAVNERIKETADRYDKVKAEERDVVGRVDAQIEITKKARQGVAEWAAVYAQLAGTVKSGLQPNTALLASITMQLRDLMQKGSQK